MQAKQILEIVNYIIIQIIDRIKESLTLLTTVCDFGPDRAGY